MEIPNKEERMRYLLSRSVVDLCETILRLEEENKMVKTYKRRLTMIKNISTEPEERSKPGRPRKED